jgi:hypothetical protein
MLELILEETKKQLEDTVIYHGRVHDKMGGAEKVSVQPLHRYYDRYIVPN